MWLGNLCLTVKRQKTMKKIFNLILAALVIIGAASCTKNEEVAYQGGESLSFYAEIVNGDTRAEIVKGDGNTWNTIWEKGDKVSVTYSENTYTFTYDGEKFTCTADGVTSLSGKTVTIEPVANLNSKAGKKGWSFNTAMVTFTEGMTVELEPNTSFFRYTYSGDEDITFTVTAADKEVFVVDSDVTDTVTISDVCGENFVAFWTNNSGNPLNATLSYSIGGVKCKEKKNIALYPGKVYNLGILTPESDVWGTAGTHNTWAASTPEKVYDGGTYLVAYNLAGDTQLKFVKIGASNNGWDGAVGGASTTATVADVWSDAGGNDITLPAEGTYDVYFLPTFKYCVVKAGTAPEEFVAPTYDLYLKPNSNWLQGNARFAAYFFNGTGNIWADLTAVENGIYAVNLPTGYVNGDNVIFCRMNPGNANNGWENDKKWNQTGDLVIPTDGKNLYTINDGSWDAGSWSTK